MEKIKNNELTQYTILTNDYGVTIDDLVKLNADIYSDDINLFVKTYDKDIIKFNDVQIVKNVYTAFDRYSDIICNQDYIEKNIKLFDLSPEPIRYVDDIIERIEVYYHREGDSVAKYHSLPKKLVEKYAERANDDKKYYPQEDVYLSFVDGYFYKVEENLPEIKALGKLEEKVKNFELELIKIEQDQFNKLYELTFKFSDKINIIITNLDLKDPDDTEEIKYSLKGMNDTHIIANFLQNNLQRNLYNLKQTYYNYVWEIKAIDMFFHEEEIEKHRMKKKGILKKYVLDSYTQVKSVVRGCESEEHQYNVYTNPDLFNESIAYLYHLDDNLYVIEIDYAAYAEPEYEIYNTLEEGQERLKELENSCPYPVLRDVVDEYESKYNVDIKVDFKNLSLSYLVKYNNEYLLQTDSLEESEETIKDITNLIGSTLNGYDIQHIKIKTLKFPTGNQERVEMKLENYDGDEIDVSKTFDEKDFKSNSFKDLLYKNFDSFLDNEKGMEL